MEENIFDALPGFDRMVEQKAFEELSDGEKRQVLQYITEATYTRFREAVGVAKQQAGRESSVITPDPAVKTRLMESFGNTEIPAAPSAALTLSRFLNYRIPLYQAGFAASVLFFLLFYLLLQNYRMAGQVAVADTVYINKPILQKDTAWLEKTATKVAENVIAENRPSHARRNRIAYASPENPVYARQMQDAMSRMSVISGLGKDNSVNHDSALMKLVAVGY